MHGLMSQDIYTFVVVVVVVKDPICFHSAVPLWPDSGYGSKYAAILQRYRSGGHQRGGLRNKVSQPVRLGLSPSHHQRRHDPKSFRTRMGFCLDQDVRIR